MTKPNQTTIPRIQSVDILRGLVMIVMALDHVRDFVSSSSISPEDITQTYPALFWTRCITHFCSPAFIFLAGTSSYLWEWVNNKTKKELSWLLFTRGLWLIFIEVVVMNFLWSFSFPFPAYIFQVIWVIGLSMVVMAAMIHLPWRVQFGISVITIVLHNTLDGISFAGDGIESWLWAVLHVSTVLFSNEQYFVLAGYPLIPWFAVMSLGYCFGRIYRLDVEERKKFLIKAGIIGTIAFFLIRGINIYGDPVSWEPQDTLIMTIISF